MDRAIRLQPWLQRDGGGTQGTPPPPETLKRRQYVLYKWLGVGFYGREQGDPPSAGPR
jgi:hypothetical protein